MGSKAVKSRLQALDRAVPSSYLSPAPRYRVPLRAKDPRRPPLDADLIQQSSQLARVVNPFRSVPVAALQRWQRGDDEMGHFEEGTQALLNARRRAARTTLYAAPPSPTEISTLIKTQKGPSSAEGSERIGVKTFLRTIARPPRREDLSGNSKVVDALRQRAEGVKKEDLQPLEEGTDAPLVLSASTKALKDAGVTPPMRRYIHWCLQRAHSVETLDAAIIEPKKPKGYRGWGPRVQNGKRVRGEKRPGEK